MLVDLGVHLECLWMFPRFFVRRGDHPFDQAEAAFPLEAASCLAARPVDFLSANDIGSCGDGNSHAWRGRRPADGCLLR